MKMKSEEDDTEVMVVGEQNHRYVDVVSFSVATFCSVDYHLLLQLFVHRVKMSADNNEEEAALKNNISLSCCASCDIGSLCSFRRVVS